MTDTALNGTEPVLDLDAMLEDLHNDFKGDIPIGGEKMEKIPEGAELVPLNSLTPEVAQKDWQLIRAVMASTTTTQVAVTWKMPFPLDTFGLARKSFLRQRFRPFSN